MGGIVIFLYMRGNTKTYTDCDHDGLIEIYYIEELNNIRYNLTGICTTDTCNGYELMRNLDFSRPSSYRSGTVDSSYITGEGWDPIGNEKDNFNTTFEGHGYTIDNLYIDRPSTKYLGLFGYIERDTRIRNIGVTNVYISGAKRVGALVGGNFEGTITNSYATGDVSGTDVVGGLVGFNWGTITKSYATGEVSGSDVIGGLVGCNRATITKSYATGYVISYHHVIGGLVGSNYEGSITQAYATGNVSGWEAVGALVGLNVGGTITHGFWNTDAYQRVDGSRRTADNKIGVGEGRNTSVGLTLSNMKVACSRYKKGICQLDTSFIFSNGNLPKLKDIK